MGESNLFLMKKKFQIAVPNPCGEKWNAFTKTSNGGFCSSCQKEVIDFTTWNDEELKAYFKNLHRSTCGRFRQQQLKVYDSDHSTNRYGWLSVFFAGGLLLCSPRQTFAQQRDFAHHPIEHFNKEDSTPTVKISPSIFQVTGVVNSPEEHLPIPGVNVVLKGTTYNTTTDADGRFSITLKNPGPSPILEFAFIGFETTEYHLPTGTAHHDVHIEMFWDKEALQEQVIIGGCYVSRWYDPRTWWRKVKDLF